MKGPKKRMSNADYSSLVVLSCMAIGSIVAGTLMVCNANGIFMKILSAIGWLIVCAFFVYSVIYQVKMIREEGEKENESC